MCICGSDLNAYRGTNACLTYPRIPGYEFSAEIVEIGANDRGFRAGDIVTANSYFNCGRCYSCRRGLVNACMSNQSMAFHLSRSQWAAILGLRSRVKSPFRFPPTRMGPWQVAKSAKFQGISPMTKSRSSRHSLMAS